MINNFQNTVSWANSKWQIFFFKNIAVATVYTNLGDDAVVHAINETKTSVVVTSQELLPKLYQLLEQVNVITSVVFIS